MARKDLENLSQQREMTLHKEFWCRMISKADPNYWAGTWCLGTYGGGANKLGVKG